MTQKRENFNYYIILCLSFFLRIYFFFGGVWDSEPQDLVYIMHYLYQLN